MLGKGIVQLDAFIVSEVSELLLRFGCGFLRLGLHGLDFSLESSFLFGHLLFHFSGDVVIGFLIVHLQGGNSLILLGDGFILFSNGGSDSFFLLGHNSFNGFFLLGYYGCNGFFLLRDDSGDGFFLLSHNGSDGFFLLGGDGLDFFFLLGYRFLKLSGFIDTLFEFSGNIAEIDAENQRNDGTDGKSDRKDFCIVHLPGGSRLLFFFCHKSITLLLINFQG